MSSECSSSNQLVRENFKLLKAIIRFLQKPKNPLLVRLWVRFLFKISDPALVPAKIADSDRIPFRHSVIERNF